MSSEPSVERFRSNSPGVACEEFDDEVIIVNLETGTYFSTPGIGAEIWRLLAEGAPVSIVGDTILALYDVDAATLAEPLSAFIAMLLENGLLVALEDGAPAASPLELPASEMREFQPPVLESYSDMQDILLLDPIHEVDDKAGWPNPK